MKISDALSGVRRLCIETAPFIYFVERNPAYVAKARAVFQVVDAGIIQAITSTITLTEVLNKPIQAGNQQIENAYRTLLLKTTHLEMVSVTVDVAEQAAHLRAAYNLRTPDALQLATGMVSGCDSFLTNDRQLHRVREIRVLVLDELEV